MPPAQAAAATAAAPQPAKAKSTILFFLCGGSSHLDMWDLKPEAPLEYRGLFQPINTSAPGVQISEHLPLTAKQAHHLAIVRSVRSSVNTNDHHAGYYYNLTGHEADPTFSELGEQPHSNAERLAVHGLRRRLAHSVAWRIAEHGHVAAHAQPIALHAARSVRGSAGD